MTYLASMLDNSDIRTTMAKIAKQIRLIFILFFFLEDSEKNNKNENVNFVLN
jgi:hypothetical protein